MTERATVRQVNSREATVELRSLADCGGCSACGALTSKRPQLLRTGNPRGIPLRPGDVVDVGFAAGKAVRAGFMVLILPLLLFFGAFSAAGALGGTSEPLKVLAGLCGLAAGFGIAWLRGRSSANLPEVLRIAPAGRTTDAASCGVAGSSLDRTRSA